MQKHSKKDLEKYRSIFFLAGLILAMIAALTTFSLKIKSRPSAVNGENLVNPYENRITRIVEVQSNSGRVLESPVERLNADQGDLQQSSQPIPVWACDEGPFMMVDGHPRQAWIVIQNHLSKILAAPTDSSLAYQRVFIELTIDVAGSIRDVEIDNAPSARMEYTLSDALQKLSAFRPASKNGKPRAVKLIVPVMVGKD